jgi:hypothetical protein
MRMSADRPMLVTGFVMMAERGALGFSRVVVLIRTAKSITKHANRVIVVGNLIGQKRGKLDSNFGKWKK